MAVVHVVGGGLAGLAAAVKVVADGGRAVVYEMAPNCGGRCRSLDDPSTGLTIDNGNHLMLSGNHELVAYLAMIGGAEHLRGSRRAAFPLVDLATGARGALDLGIGRWPWPLLRRTGRPPGVRLRDLVRLGRIFARRPGETVAERVGPGCPLMRSVWEPLTAAILNETPDHGDADLLAATLRETVLKGAPACRPLVPAAGLSDTFIDPALDFLAARGSIVRTGISVTGLETDAGPAAMGDAQSAGPIRALRIGKARDRVAIEPEDSVVLAVPAGRAADLLPGLRHPPPGETIVNLHFRRDQPNTTAEEPILIGLLGSTAQWLFPRPTIWSVTISAAGEVADRDASSLAEAVWSEIVPVLGNEGRRASIPRFRVIKERRATVRQRPDDQALRPPARTPWPNLWLAGDWTDTGIPATMEGAVRSGFRAGLAALGATSG